MKVWVVALATAAACRGSVRSGSIEIHGQFAFAPVTRDEAAVYFTVVNHGSGPDTLTSATCACASGAAFHEELASGMVMRQTVPIPPGDSLHLWPGGMHLMLTALDTLPKAGDRLTLSLRFARAGEIPLDVPVRPYAR